MRQFNFSDSRTDLVVILLRQRSYSKPLEIMAHAFTLLDQTLVLCPLYEETAEYLQGGGQLHKGIC